MKTWRVQDAKARFSEFLEACMRNVDDFANFGVALLNPFETPRH